MLKALSRLLLLALLPMAKVTAGDDRAHKIAIAGPAFYDSKAEGWFWYEDPPEERVLEDKKAPAEVKLPPSPQPPAKPPVPGAAPLSVAWIRENIDKFRDRAIDQPSPENVRAYYYLQRVVMDKSQAFAEASTDVIRRDPFLDEDTRRPVGTYAANALSRAAGEQRDRLLQDVGKRAGFYFFFESSCVLCAAQAEVVEALAAKSGLPVIPVSLDGKPLKGFERYKTFKVDTGQAERLGIKQTPALALGVPSKNRIEIVSYGAVALDVLENRVLLAARDTGLVTNSQFEQTRPVAASGLLAGEVLQAAHISNEDSAEVFVEKLKLLTRDQ